MANITRIKNNQITDNTIEYQKIKSGTLVGTNFNANLTLNSNVTILGNLTVANSFAQLNSINTYINDPLVVFNNNYTGSPTYDIGMLINRNLSSLAPYGAVNAAFVWKEADASFEALMTTESGTTAGSINNSGWANLRVGNVTATTATITDALTAGVASFASINGTPIGNATPSTGNFTTLVATNFSTGNAVISGGYISSLTNATIVTETVTNETVTNFYTANARIQGGYIQNLANVTAALGYITTLNATNGNVTTLQVNNLNSGNAAITGAQTYIGTGAQLIANIYAGTGYFTNLSGANIEGVNGDFTTFTAANFSTPNAVVTTETVTNETVTNFYTANARIAGGYIQNLANITATTGYIVNENITNGNATTLVATNFSTGNAQITGTGSYLGTGASLVNSVYGTTGYFTNLSASNLSIVTENVTTLYAQNFSSPNAVITGGSVNNSPIGNATPSTAAFTTLTASGATTITGTTESTTSGTGALIVSGGVGVAKNLNVGGNVVITGNLTVQGDVTTVNTATLDVEDLNITVAKGAATPSAANGAGLTVDGASATILYTSATDSWNLNKQLIGLGATFSNATATTSPTTGALVVTGGVGIGGDLYAYKINATYANVITGYFNNLSSANISGVTNGNFTTLTASNFSTANSVITTEVVTNETVTNFYTANARIAGGYIQNLANITATTGYIATLNSTAGNVTTLVSTNFSTGNAVITGGSINGSPIGSVTSSTGRFTTLTSTSVFTSAGNLVANSNTTSVDTTTGAIVITGYGGLAVGGNIHAGVYNTSLHNIRGNLLLGLGEDQAADSALTINLNTEAPILSNATVHLSGAPGKDAVYGADSFGDGTTSTFAARHARGTAATPLPVQNKDPLGGFTARGYGLTGYNLDQDRFGSGMGVYANENFTDTAQGTYVTIQAVPDGTRDSIFGLIVAGNGQSIVTTNNVSTTPFNGALVVNGGVGIQGNLNVAAVVKVSGLSFFNGVATANANLVAASQENSTSSTTGALTVVGGAGVMANVFVGGASTFGSNRTAGNDTVTQGKNDATLIWARSGNTYDQVVIGNSATTGTLVQGAKLIVNSTDSMIIPVGTNAQRPENTGGSAVLGMLRYNTTTSAPEYYDGTAWTGFATNLTVITDEQFNGDGVTVDFTLAQPTTTASTIVSINGILQLPTLAYSCSGTTLTFTEAPALGDIIDVRRLVTTTVVSSIASVNGYMQFICDNTGAYVYTGSSGTAPATYWEPTGGQVSSLANVVVASANTATTIDTIDNTKYRSAKYVIQITNGTNYQVQEALAISNGTTATITTYAVISTNGNLGVVQATQSGSNTLVQFIAANATNTVRISKDYLRI